MGLLDAALMLGMLLGTLLSSIIFAAVGYVILFGICTLCLTIALLYTYFFIPESVQIEQTDEAKIFYCNPTFELISDFIFLE